MSGVLLTPLSAFRQAAPTQPTMTLTAYSRGGFNYEAHYG